MDVRKILLDNFAAEIRNDEPINGADTVEFICDLVSRIEAEDQARKARPPQAFTNFSINGLNQLEELAAMVLDGDPAAMEKAREARKRIEEMKAEMLGCRSLIDQARSTYTNDELEIDDNPIVSESDEHVWVSAWVYVPRKQD